MSEDVYKRGAMKVLGQPEHVVTHEQRQAFKEAFFECYRDRVYKLGEYMPLAVAEDALQKARNLMEHRLKQVWPVGTIVLVDLAPGGPAKRTLTTAKVIGHHQADVRIEVCKKSKKGTNYRCYLSWDRLAKWPLSTHDI